MTQVTEVEMKALIAPRFTSDPLATEWYETAPIPGFCISTARNLGEQGRGYEVALFLAAVDSGVHA